MKLNLLILRSSYEESVWMKICSKRGREALYIYACICLLTVEVFLLRKVVITGLNKM